MLGIEEVLPIPINRTGYTEIQRSKFVYWHSLLCGVLIAVFNSFQEPFKYTTVHTAYSKISRVSKSAHMRRTTCLEELSQQARELDEYGNLDINEVYAFTNNHGVTLHVV